MMRFDEMLLKAQHQQQKIQESLYLTHALENKCQFESAGDETLRLAAKAEKFAVTTRELAYLTGRPDAKELVDAIIEENVPVTAEFTPEGWFKLCFPAMLPRKEGGNVDYIRGILYPPMKRFSASNDPRREFNDSVIVFRHVYDYQRPERLFRDHDNIEINAVVDILSLFLLRSDSPLRLTHHYCSVRGKADCTEVYIVEQEDFIPFLLALADGKIGAPAVKETLS